MRLFRRKKNNRGFSLVETVCAVAIIGLTSTAIGSAMIMSTDTYQRGNTEVDVQKEAQLATNLIGNLLVGATDASYAGNVLTIYGEGIEYEIIYDPATKKLTYKETKGASITTGTLAENVASFTPNLDNWDSMNARIDMAIEENGRNYEASYNTTARNRASFNVGSAESAFIICETELVLEPGEVYDLPVTIYGNPEVEGINLEASETSLAGPNMGTTFLDDYDDGITIHVDSNASGLFTFVVETAAQKDGIALDAKTVTVKVRRATGINKDAQISGTPLRENTTYRIYADVAADYPDKIIAKEFDDNYVDPHYATFSIVAEGGAVEDLNFEEVTRDEECSRPYIDIRLLQDLPFDSKITVYMESAHANGVHNKTGNAYATIKTSYVIENLHEAITGDSGIRRGNDSFPDFQSSLDEGAISQAFGGSHRYMFRYKVKGEPDSAYSDFYKLIQGNASDEKFNAAETYLWLVDYAYDINVILVCVEGADTDNPKLTYPQDEDLLAELQQYYPEMQKGWDDNDLNHALSATQPAQYGGTIEIGAAKLKYKNDAGEYVESLGNEENRSGFTLNVGSDYKEVYFDGINLEPGHFEGSFYMADFYIYENGGWSDINPTDYFGVQYSNQFYKIYNANSNASGKQFKVVPKVKTRYKTIDADSINYKDDPQNAYTTVDTNEMRYLGDFDSGKGCFYFSVN